MMSLFSSLQGVPNDGKFETNDQLVVTLTAIIYTCSVAHAAANFQQYDEYAAPFRMAFTMHGVPPKDKVRRVLYL